MINKQILKQTFDSYMEAWDKLEQDFPNQLILNERNMSLPFEVKCKEEPTPEQISKAHYIWLGWLHAVPSPMYYTEAEIDYGFKIGDNIFAAITIDFARKEWHQAEVLQQENNPILAFYKDLNPNVFGELRETLHTEWKHKCAVPFRLEKETKHEVQRRES